MKAPSFFVDSETDSQLMLQYRTRRRGFHYYVQGQVRHTLLIWLISYHSSFFKVKEIGKVLFLNAGDVTNKLEAKLKKQEIVFDTAVFHFELTFNNKAYTDYLAAKESR